jgi:Type I restriction enzyme R protein N terminus (HSDR_N)
MEAKLICVITDRERRDTPEERVRQAFACELLTAYGYPKARLAIELRIKVGSGWKQVDIAIFGANMPHKQEHIEVIIECKSGVTRILAKDRDQLYSYGAACLNCKWLSIVSGSNRETFKKSPSNGTVKLVPYEDIPHSDQSQPAPSRLENGHGVGDPKPQYASFENAKQKAARLLREHGIGTSTAWRTFFRENPDPEFPIYPDREYANAGWNGWPDFFGIGFRPFEGARAFVRTLKLAGDTAWREYSGSGKRPGDIPSNPHIAYKDKGYVNFGDWLGTNNTSNAKRECRDFDAAHKFVLNLKLGNLDDWRRYCRGEIRGRTLPEDIPKSPDRARLYKERWLGWSHWITGKSPVILEFKQARAIARELKLTTVKQWNQWLAENGAQRPDVPRSPVNTYKDKGWISWGDWLGTTTVSMKKREFLPFEEARHLVRESNLKNEVEWRKFSKGDSALGKRPDNIPANPEKYYATKGWVNFRHWLGLAPRK